MWIKQPWKAYSHPQDMFRGKGIGVNEGIDTLLHPLNNMLWPLHCLCWEDHFLYQGKLGSKQGGFDPCSPPTSIPSRNWFISDLLKSFLSAFCWDVPPASL